MGGTTLTDADIERMAGEYERGEYALAGAWVKRPAGRPASAEPLVNVTVRMTEADRARIDARARETGRTRSQLVREAIAAAIA